MSLPYLRPGLARALALPLTLGALLLGPSALAETPTQAPPTMTPVTQTPGTPVTIPTPTAGPPVDSLPYPAPGEVIFTEIFIDPAGSGDKLEFTEIKNLTAAPLRIEGCVLIEGSPDISATCSELGDITGNCDELEGVDGMLYVAAGGHTVFAQRSDLAACGVASNSDYINAISYANTKEETVSLYCPGDDEAMRVVASMTYNWSTVEGKDAGLTYQLDPEFDTTDPTNTAHWCVSPVGVDSLFCATDDGPAFGSPAKANAPCLVIEPTTPPEATGSPDEPDTEPPPTEAAIPWPLAGEVIFTELFIDSEGSDRLEFVELTNMADEARRLEDCVLIEGSADTTQTCGALGGLTGNCSTVSGDEGIVNIDAGGRVVFGQTPDLEADCGVDNAWNYPDAISMVNTKLETMSLYCPNVEDGGFTEVFSVSYNWGASYGEAGQTWMLDPSAEGSPSDMASWCPTERIEDNLFCTTEDGPAYGSPWEANPECGEAPPTPTPPTPTPGPITDRFPEPGEVIFTEIMIDPPGDEALEFVEVKSLASDDIRLQGCFLIEGSESTTAECEELDNLLGNCDEIEGLGLPLILSNGELAVLAQSASKLGEEICDVPVDADYLGSMQFANTVPETLRLFCPNNQTGDPQLIAQLDYDWDTIGGEAGQTWSLDPSSEGDPNNPLSWCTADEAGAPTFCNEDEGALSGTPGLSNPACPDRTPIPTNQPPENIQLVFTEIMIGPAPSTTNNVDNIKAHEWFEWVNQGTTAVQLGGCYLEVDKIEARGTDEANPRTYHFSDGDGLSTVPAGDRQLWAKDGCLLSQRDDTDETICLQTNAEGGPDALAYASIEFSNSSAQYLALYCLDIDGQASLIDEIEFDYAALGEPTGRSWELDPVTVDPVDNDDASNWCLAPLAGEAQLYAVSNHGSNFGTPGLINNCEVVEPPPPAEGCNGCFCRLDTTGSGPSRSTPPSWALFLSLMGLGLITRRPR